MEIVETMKSTEEYWSDHRDMPQDLQKKAKILCWKYNATSPEQEDERSEILKELLGTCHPHTFIEPSFRCDYGFNIHTHGLTVINSHGSFMSRLFWKVVNYVNQTTKDRGI